MGNTDCTSGPTLHVLDLPYHWTYRTTGPTSRLDLPYHTRWTYMTIRWKYVSTGPSTGPTVPVHVITFAGPTIPLDLPHDWTYLTSTRWTYLITHWTYLTRLLDQTLDQPYHCTYLTTGPTLPLDLCHWTYPTTGATLS